MWDQRVFDIEQRVAQRQDCGPRRLIPHRLCRSHVQCHRLRLDHCRKIVGFPRIWFQRTEAVDGGFQLGEPAVKSGLRDGRRQMADQRGTTAPFGEQALGRIVRSIEVEIRQIADQPVRPARGGQPRLLARHEFQRAMGAEMQHRVGGEILAYPTIEGRERMRRRKPRLEEQPHRVTLVAEAGLHTDEHVAELPAKHENPAAVGLRAARRRSPLLLDLAQMRLTPDMIVGGNTRRHIGVRAKARGVAFQDGNPKRIHARRHLDLIPAGGQRMQRVEQGLEHGQVGRRPGRPSIRREIEQHDSQLLFRPRPTLQRHQLGHARGQHRRPLSVHEHIVPLGAAAATKGDRPRRAVQLRQRHHHRGLDRRQSARIALPLRQRLEFDGMRADIGHVQRSQQRLGRLGIVIGRPANQREPGQRHDRIHDRHTVFHEEPRYRLARIQPAGKGRQHAQAALLHGRDHAIIMPRIARQHIGPQHQQPDRARLARAPRQLRRVIDHAAARRGMVKPDLRVFDGCCHLQFRARRRARIPPHQHAQHVGEILLRAGQPVLHGQEVAAHVLRLARDETQHARQALEHLHLAAPAAARLGAAAQFLQHRHRAALARLHVEAPQLWSAALPLQRTPQHSIAVTGLAPRLSSAGSTLADMFVQEQHPRPRRYRTRAMSCQAPGQGCRQSSQWSAVWTASVSPGASKATRSAGRHQRGRPYGYPSSRW